MELLTSPILTHLASAILMFVAGFYFGTSKAERRNKRYRRIWGI